MKTALLLIDIQKDYLPGGRMELVNPLEAAGNAYELLQCFREHHQSHVHIQHVALSSYCYILYFRHRWYRHSRFRGAFCWRAAGHQALSQLLPRDEICSTCSKAGVSNAVIITGMMTHMCVDATARAAVDFGFQVIVAEDACATRDLKYGDTVIPAEHVHKAFLAALKSYGEVMTTDQVIAHLAAENEKLK